MENSRFSQFQNFGSFRVVLQFFLDRFGWFWAVLPGLVSARFLWFWMVLIRFGLNWLVPDFSKYDHLCGVALKLPHQTFFLIENCYWLTWNLIHIENFLKNKKTFLITKWHFLDMSSYKNIFCRKFSFYLFSLDWKL